jgi:hypothetical protein
VFEYPSKAIRDKYNATGTPFLSGFENYLEDGTHISMNFILSNGDRSKQRDRQWPTKYTHMMPADARNKIRSVNIHYNHYYCHILGFEFFDKDGALLWEIGWTDADHDVETVEIAENERIIGVKAKLHPDWQTAYTDWQFQIGKFV